VFLAGLQAPSSPGARCLVCSSWVGRQLLLLPPLLLPPLLPLLLLLALLRLLLPALLVLSMMFAEGHHLSGCKQSDCLARPTALGHRASAGETDRVVPELPPKLGSFCSCDGAILEVLRWVERQGRQPPGCGDWAGDHFCCCRLPPR
jgi:hypothetical protein